MKQETRFDVHQTLTDKIVAALESGAGDFQLPWTRTGQANERPVNIASGEPYNGINVLSLWVTALSLGYASPIWGTYRQWSEKGAQVRRGEKASVVVFYKSLGSRETAEGEESEASEPRRVARASFVFNAAQVDGFVVPEAAKPEGIFDPISAAEAFTQATGAKIEEGGDIACFIPSADLIRMPLRGRFTGSATMSPAESYYATLVHELVHWSGAKSRLARDMGRFGTEAYAMEELVAELGAAFLCADLGISAELRPDHAAYIQGWLKVLKDDKRAVFNAAAKASEAAGYLKGFSAPDPA